jgi:UDP-GlcNAc:undecaprenyl-phosphate GlcNAc-1-phosphate transferase
VPLFLAFLIALSVTTACTPFLVRWAPAIGLNDSPGDRKVHAAPVPRIGGIAMVSGILISTLLMVHLSAPIIGLLFGGLVLLVFGVWDDRSDLDYRVKFLGQFIAVGLCMAVGDVRIASITLDARIQLPAMLSWGLTFAFLVGVTNAVNLSDGLDGLAGGLALLCLCAIAAFGAISNNEPVTMIALIEAGAILGFLRFNTHPARVFMGDGGSQMLGFSIGVLAILVTQGESNVLSAALPLLLLGLPILDTLTVMARRTLSGRSPFFGDRNHFHHRLLELGFAHREAVIIIYCLQLALFLLAYFLRFESDLSIVAAFVAFSVALLAAFRWAARKRWHAHASQNAPGESSFPRRLRRAGQATAIVRCAGWIMGLGLIVYAAVVIAATTHVGGDISLLSASMLVLLFVLSRSASAGTLTWSERLAAYVSVMLVVYLDQTTLAHAPAFAHLTWVIIGVTAAAAFARFVFSETRRFQVTALDLLVAFIALVIPNLPGFVSLPEDLPAGVVKAVVLLYVVEMIDGIEVRRSLPRAVLAVMLGAIAVRGLPILLP